MVGQVNRGQIGLMGALLAAERSGQFADLGRELAGGIKSTAERMREGLEEMNRQAPPLTRALMEQAERAMFAATSRPLGPPEVFGVQLASLPPAKATTRKPARPLAEKKARRAKRKQRRNR